MDALSTFFSSNMVFVFFTYGLAFFVMGLAVALEARRASALVLSAILPFLAAFALIHSFVEWIDMFIVVESHSPGLTWDTSALRSIKVIMLAISAACLVQFGAELIVRTYHRYYWLRWLAISLFAFWALTAFLFPNYPISNMGPLATTDACMRCHSPEVNVDAISREWMPNADVSARYILYLPGSILAALAIAIQGRSFAKAMRLRRIGRDCYLAAVGFGLNGFFAGLVVPPAAYFPALSINYNSFFNAIGIPPQVFRAASALAIAYFMVRILRVFEIEQGRQLEAANEQRFKAQQEALEVQQRAKAEMERWNRELEQRVEERTREIQQRNKELGTLNAIAVTVNQSLDLDKILGDTLDKVLEVMEVDSGAIFLYDDHEEEMVIKAHRGLSRDFLEWIARLELEEGLNGELASFRSLNAAPAERADGQRRLVGLIQGGLFSIAAVPLRSKGRLLGMVCVVGADGHTFSDDLLELLVAIARQINLGVVNAQLFTETQQREEEAQALYKIGTEISALLDIDKILNSVVEKATLLIQTEAAILSVADDKSGEIVVRATHGCRTEAIRQLRLRPGQGVNGKVVATGLPVRVYDYQADNNLQHEADVDHIVRQEGLRGHLGVPLRMGDRIFGALVVAERRPRKFNDGYEYLLLHLANQAAIAIENAELYGQVQHMAVLEERYRIAREMHDGLAQVLGYLSLKVKSLAMTLEQQEVEKTQGDIVELDNVIQSAYADVRESILSLRTPVLPGKGFLPTLGEFLQGFTQQSHINAHLDVADEEAVKFSEAAQVQLVRIIQEALSNVRKHAKATNAWIRFAKEGDFARITIEDDGQGFDPARSPSDDRQHLGLQTMRERAEGISGSLEINATLRRGTKVIARIPLSREGVN